MVDLSRIDTTIKLSLDKFGFDGVPFDSLAQRLIRDGFDPERNRLKVRVDLPPEGTITNLPEADSRDYSSLSKLGRAAIDAGRVGVVVLNGGMATRFGGVVKGTVPAVEGRSFLDLKLSQVEGIGSGKVPVMLMNSFATLEPTKAHLRTLDLPTEVRSFCQMVSLRLTPQGDLFIGSDGKPSLHAPGHGDLPYALVSSGELDRFVGGGGKYLTMSNVDNLGASLNPAVLGAHIASKNPMTVELVRTNPGDVGGSPTLVNGKVSIVETFRMPTNFKKTFSTFNTNTFVFDAEALRGDWKLDWFAVSKTVDGKKAIQFERLAGQITEMMEVTWLKVPRDGKESRFIPIKTPEELETQSSFLRQVLAYQGVL